MLHHFHSKVGGVFSYNTMVPIIFLYNFLYAGSIAGVNDVSVPLAIAVHLDLDSAVIHSTLCKLVQLFKTFFIE